MKTITLLALATGLSATTTARADDVIQTNYGLVKGITDNEISEFRGIPFARPPVGDLRWKAPVEPEPWSGTRDANRFGPGCIQPPSPHNPVEQSEDCLNLNIWKDRAAGDDAKLPVMVWIHGGAFSVGANSLPLYDGRHLAKQGVLVVTINYRLGLLGFFAHPALTAENEQGDLANYGLMDAIAALKWINGNIASFGGDPDNVTIFGESAGAVMVNALMTTENARGLFSKAISQSAFNSVPSRSMRDGPDNAESIGEDFAKSKGISGSSTQALQALRALPAREIAGISIGGGTSGTLPKALPITDGRILKETAQDAFLGGRVAPVPFMTGSNSWESSLTPGVAERPEATLAALGPLREKAEILYAGSGDAVGMALDIKTDVSATEPVRAFARAHAAQGHPAYAYHFSYVPSVQRNIRRGTPHGGEIAYVFGNLKDKDVKLSGMDYPAATPADLAISKSMVESWIRFASTGQPGTVGSSEWKPFSQDDFFMEFGPDVPTGRPAFRREALDLLEQAPASMRLPIPD